MYCRSCGNNNDEDNLFCVNCGTALIKEQKKFKDWAKSVDSVKHEETKVKTYGELKQSSNNFLDDFNKHKNIVAMFIAGIVGVISFFLPFWGINSLEFSGWQLIRSILDAIKLGSYVDSQHYLNFLEAMWKNNEGVIGSIVFFFILLGPIFFGLFSLQLLFSPLKEKGYNPGRPGSFAVFYSIVGFISFYFIGDEIGISLNFFTFVDVGYWISAIAFIAAWFYGE